MSSRSTTLRMAATLSLLAFAFMLAGCDRTSDQDEQVAELEQQVSDLEAQLDQTEAALAESQDANADLRGELSDTQATLAETQDELSATELDLGTTQAQLLDAEAQLAQVGELVLANGTDVGQVLGAKTSPYRVIVFDAAGLFRVAQVSQGVKITAGGDDFTLTQFGKLLSSTDPDDAKFANGNYQVIVKKGLATSIRKSKA
jgi:multidrug efflux pump subunit AcrA (membrane-fusion protein)